MIVRHELSCAGFDVFAVRVDSAEALAIVRERDAHVPFIFVSGTIGEEAAVAAMRNGAQDYIIRPDSCQWSNVNSPTRRFATNDISPISTSPTSRIVATTSRRRLPPHSVKQSTRGSSSARRSTRG